MPSPLPSRLCVVCDAEACERAGWTVIDFAAACLAGGARFLQLRSKTASTRAFLDSALLVAERCHAAGATLIVNDRADVASLARAEGVHVGQDDLSPVQVRAVAGEGAIVGLSTHTPAQLQAALADPAVSYVAIGPVFATATKATGYDAVGLERVRTAAALARAAGRPLVAIGGITLEHAQAVVDAGADSVAVISDLLSTGHPEARVAAFLRALLKAES